MHSYYGAANAGRELDLGTGYTHVEQDKATQVEHPIVKSHPESGKRSLYVNAMFTEYINGLHRDESDLLLNYLL